MTGLSCTHWRMNWRERAYEWLRDRLAEGADWRLLAALYAVMALRAWQVLS